MKKVFIGSLILLSLVGCSKNKKEVNKDASKFKKEYESLNGEYSNVKIKERNPIVYVNINKINKILNNGSGLIYLGNPRSIACRDNIETLLEAAKQTGLKKIYYFNTYEINLNDSKYEKLRKYVNNIKGMNIIFVQDKDNIKVTFYGDDNYKRYDSEKKDSILKEYRNSIHEMLDDLCDESC